jgi:multiple sugar transport system permease protein
MLQSKPAKVFIYVFSAIFCLVTLYPYFVMFVNSFKSLNEIFAIPPTVLPTTWQWQNYVNIWKDIPLFAYVRNSFVVSVCATALCIVCAVPTGYAMARMKFPGKDIFMSTIIVTQMFSTVVLMVGIFKLMVLLKLNNSLVGIILLIAAFNQAFASWMLSGTFRSISFELEEAALIDGCNRMNAMLRVVLPLAMPGIVTAVIFVFISGWNEYTLTLILISDQMKKSLNTGIKSFFGYTNTEWHYVFAASMLATAPLLAFFQVLEKHLMGGLTAGGVKG